MKYKVIGVLDTLIRRYMPLQCVSDLPDDDIIESHRRACLVGKIPADMAQNYVLYRFGEFNDETGKFDVLDQPVLLANLADFLPKKETKEAIVNGEATN